MESRSFFFPVAQLTTLGGFPWRCVDFLGELCVFTAALDDRFGDGYFVW